MDAGLLDVLHDATEIEVGAVEQRVDVDLEGVVEEPVDQHRAVRADLGGPAEVVAEHRVVVDDLHAATTEHIARADEHGIADGVGDRLGLVVGRGGAELGRREAGGEEHLTEGAAVLGEVDRARRRTDDRDALRLQCPGQAERRLAAELHDRHRRPARPRVSARNTSRTSSRVSGSKYSRSLVS